MGTNPASEPTAAEQLAEIKKILGRGVLRIHPVSGVRALQDSFHTERDRCVELKEALREALVYLECDSGARGDLVGCCVPLKDYNKWIRLTDG
jgi:hypothetical protein